MTNTDHKAPATINVYTADIHKALTAAGCDSDLIKTLDNPNHAGAEYYVYKRTDKVLGVVDKIKRGDLPDIKDVYAEHGRDNVRVIKSYELTHEIIDAGLKDAYICKAWSESDHRAVYVYKRSDAINEIVDGYIAARRASKA